MPDHPPTEIFDMELRALRRDRAFVSGPELFLYERAFDDCLGRLAHIRRRFRSALLIGCLDPGWRTRLEHIVDALDVTDPGPSFAGAAGGKCIVEEDWAPPSATYDLCMAIGTLDTVNDLPHALRSVRNSLGPGSLLIGAMAGGETLPQLRLVMHMADRVSGASTPHAHPRIEAASLAPLLTACGFVEPVVDVDRVQVSYPTLDKLVSDLRRMGATNILRHRSKRPLLRPQKAAAETAFQSAGNGSRTVETFEILHFAAWSPPT